MADILNKDQKKKALSKRVIDTENIEEYKEALEEKEINKSKIKTIIMLLIIIVILILIFFISTKQYSGYSESWRLEYGTGETDIDTAYVDYKSYLSGFVRVSRDGASYINNSGESIWNQSYEMDCPYVSVSGEYCAIAEQRKNKIYIMNENGSTGEIDTELPISKISVSSNGVVYALLEDKIASYICVYSKEGKKLDISIKSILSGDGYPVDMAVSPDGTELIVSFIYIENAAVKNKIVFYNLAEVGKNVGANRVVGGFTEDFASHLTARVRFSSNASAQAFYDGGIAFFSLKVLISPELIKTQEINETIRAIGYNDKYIALIVDNADPEVNDTYRVMVYKSDGEEVFDKTFSMEFTDIAVSDENIIIYNSEEILLYDMHGRIRFMDNLDFKINKLRSVDKKSNLFSSDIIVGSDSFVEKIKLK